MLIKSCDRRIHRLEVCLKAVEILSGTNDTLVCRSPHKERMLQNQITGSFSILAEHYYVPNGGAPRKSNAITNLIMFSFKTKLSARIQF